MNAIRYYSKFGHSKLLAQAIEDLVGAKALTIEQPLSEPVDTLYLGAGIFLASVDKKVISFIQSLQPEKVKRVILFGSSAIIKDSTKQMREALKAKGITVAEKDFKCKGSMGPAFSGHPNAKDIEDFKNFVKTV